MASFNGNIGTPSGAFNLKVEYSYTQSTSGNYTDITATGYVKRNRSSVSPHNSSSSSTLTVDGESASYSGSYDLRSDGYKSIVSKSKRVYHNADGTKSISISFSFNGKLSSYYPNGSISQTITLPTIPRYATITSFSVSKRDETSVKYNWTTDATCNYAKYSTDNGASWHDLPTNAIISGLNANTTYNFKLQVRRADSGLWTTSGTVQQTTYNYPYVISMSKNNLIIGEEQTLNLYNPLNRTVTIKMFKDSWSGAVLYTGTGSGTTHTFTPDKNTLYASIPDSKSAYAIYSARYNNVETPTQPNNQTYSINESECIPTFNDFAYEDTNSDIIDLTGSNQILVDNYSTCKFNIIERATAKNGARIDSYVCYYGDNYITYMEQIMGLYWKIFYPERFSIPFDTTTNMNEVNCSGAGGWECIFFPVKTIAGKTYKFTFDYRNPNGYTPLSGKDGIPCQILTRVDDNDNTGNQITYITLDPAANQSTQHLEIQFTATASITYINFNFGFAADGVTTTIYLGNFKLNDINGTGNILKVQAIDSRGLSTTVTKTITNIPYKNAFINQLSTERKDGVDSKTFLVGKFTVYNGSWDGTNVENSQNRLKYVGYSVYKNNAWSNYYDITNDILSAASVRTDGNNKIYEFDYDDDIQIHENGTSGGFTVGTEYQIKVLIKDGNNSYVFTPTNYEALFNTNVSDGTVATCLHKDRNGLYHFGINCMSNDDYMVVANDKPIVDNDGNLIGLDKLGIQKTGYGDILTTDGTYTGNFYSKVVGTYIGNKVWKIEIDGRMINNNGTGSYFEWGFSITKIGNLLNLNLRNYTNTSKASSYITNKNDGTIKDGLNGYGTMFEYKSTLNALLPARYYTTSGSTGGWPLSQFSNDTFSRLVIYLKEQ